MTTTETMKALVERLNITATARLIPNNPTEKDEWKRSAFAWIVTLCNGSSALGRTLETPYWCGSAHRRWKAIRHYKLSDHDRKRFDYKPGGPVPHSLLAQKTTWSEGILKDLTEPTPPTAADVLYSLAADSSMYDNAQDFADFAAECGMNEDSRKAEQSYRECGETAKRLRNFLGAAEYENAKHAEH